MSYRELPVGDLLSKTCFAHRNFLVIDNKLIVDNKLSYRQQKHTFVVRPLQGNCLKNLREKCSISIASALAALGPSISPVNFRLDFFELEL